MTPSDPHLTTPTLRNAIVHDMRASTWPQRCLLLAVVFWLTYEWSVGNETVTPWLLVNVISETDGAASVAAAATVGFVFTSAQQLISGFTTAGGFAMFPLTAQAAWQRLSARNATTLLSWQHMGWGTRAIVGFTLGTTAVVVIQNASTGDVGIRPHRRTITQSATLVGAIVGVIAALAAALAWLGRSNPALAPATEWTLRVLGNPLLWIGLVVAVIATNMYQHSKSDDER